MHPSGFATVRARPLLADGGVVGLGGPAQRPDRGVYFSTTKANELRRWAPEAGISVFRSPSGRANGNAFDLEGRLVTCEGAEHGPGGGRRIVRSDVHSGELEVLTDRYENGRYN